MGDLAKGHTLGRATFKARRTFSITDRKRIVAEIEKALASRRHGIGPRLLFC
jgi:hypothetical protein